METEKARGLIAALENDVASCRAREGAALQEVQQLKNERVQLQLERDRLAREMAELRAQVAREAADVKVCIIVPLPFIFCIHLSI